MKTHYISWWNVENLFDTFDASQRPEWLQKKLKSSLKGWNNNVLTKKLNNLASIIQQMNNGLGPDILGVCEVENDVVLKKLIQTINLTNRNYKLIHHDMRDLRGIDIAFIYDDNKYSFDEDPNSKSFFSYEIIKRSATRDIVQATLKTKAGNNLILIGNHWPSRMAGKYMSAPYRIIAAETLSYCIERIQDIQGKETPIVVMGDFNDCPYDRSLIEYALSSSSKKKVTGGKNPYLFNLMWPLIGEEKSSYYYGATPLMIDQILVSKGIVKRNQTFSLKNDSVKIESYPEMQSGKYKKPKRFGYPASKKTFNDKGFSDHFPISVSLIEN